MCETCYKNLSQSGEIKKNGIINTIRSVSLSFIDQDEQNSFGYSEENDLENQDVENFDPINPLNFNIQL